jgi:hypothetical protein
MPWKFLAHRHNCCNWMSTQRLMVRADHSNQGKEVDKRDSISV